MADQPKSYRRGPYYRDIGSGRVRSLQMLMLVVGGVLILFGVLRGITKGEMTGGYKAIHEGDFLRATELFLKDVQARPESVPTRIGLTIACLGAKRVGEAEQQWQWLLEPVKVAGSTDATRLDDWRRRDPRQARTYEGEILWADAWLRGELALLSFRQGVSRDAQLAWKSEYEDSLRKFRQYVTRREAQLELASRPEAQAAAAEAAEAAKKRNPFGDAETDKSVSGNVPGMWTARLAKVAALLSTADRTSDLNLALRLMDIPPGNSPEGVDPARAKVLRDPPRHTTPVLQAVLERHLNRAKGYLPSDLTAHAWWLQIMAELSRRGESVSRGVIPMDGTPGANGLPERRPAHETLDDDINALLAGPETAKNGIGAYGAEELRLDPVAAVRMRLAVAAGALALRGRHKADAAKVAELTAAAESQLGIARAGLAEIRHSHAEHGELKALEEAVVDLFRVSYASDGG